MEEAPRGESWEQSNHQEIDKGALPEWDSFSLTYSVMPSFQAEYGARLVYERSRLHLWTRNGPNMDLFQGRSTAFSEGPGQELSQEEALRILEMLRRVRIIPFVEGEDGLDGVTYKLSLKHGLTHFEIGWWLDLPKGWRGIRPLQRRLEHYATIYGHKPKGQTR